MKRTILLSTVVSSLAMFSCGGDEEKETENQEGAVTEMTQDEKDQIVEEEMHAIEIEETSAELHQNQEDLNEALNDLEEL